MKMHFVAFVLVVNVVLALDANDNNTRERERRSPDKYDDSYDKFIVRHFNGAPQKHLDKTAEYKQAQEEAGNHDDDESGKSSHDHDEDDDDDHEDTAGDAKHGADEYDVDHDWYYNGKNDYERIKELSERQVVELHKKPGNCKHYKKDGMVCAVCEDPETSDTSESCAYSSEPKDKKVAFLTKKSHNYKTPKIIEVEEPEEVDLENEGEEEVAYNPSPKGPKPLKHKTESEDADYGAYKLAGDTDDVADYDEPKFAHIKAEPKNKKVINDFEIIPQSQFQSRNLNQALTDFETKDWSKCNKIMKGDMTCYYCKDHKGAVQEECMFMSASNPKNFKVEHHEAKNYDNSKKPSTQSKKYLKKPTFASRSEAIRVAPTKAPNTKPITEKKERFARLRIGRPLMPTKATVKSTAEPLVTPATNLNPNDHDDFQKSASKKTIKRTVSFTKKYSDNDRFNPDESRAIHFESHVHHFE